MHGPGSASWLLVTLCAGSGAYCLLRMRSRVEEQRRTAGGEALMGFGMAVMALPATVVQPPRGVWLGYAAVFAAAGLWMAWPAVRAPRHLHHVVGALAMVYMATAMVAAPGGHAGHGGTGVPVVTGALLLYFAGHVLLSGARLAPVGAVAAGGEGAPGGGGDRAACRAAEPRPDRAVGWADRPELVLVCRLAMSMGMLAMLVLMS
ncbi:DUF5134 domain-containing protein [Streptomyces alboflavus]|uniref:DUF5134 domain-containing protein n=1 Tax=Streptomyces alboflavus TaxID=67267 RepID=UPI003694C2F6